MWLVQMLPQISKMSIHLHVWHIYFHLSEMDMQSTTILCKYVPHTNVLPNFAFVETFAAMTYLFKYIKYAKRIANSQVILITKQTLQLNLH